MRLFLIMALLGLLGACATRPSPGEQALVSGGGPEHAAQVQADVQTILQGMARAHDSKERIARYGR